MVKKKAEARKVAKEELKQLNIRMPDELHRKLKSRCALDGIPIVQAVETLVKDYVTGKVDVQALSKTRGGRGAKKRRAPL
jgi:hypothetical protein